jgi:hypothetical protein
MKRITLLALAALVAPAVLAQPYYSRDYPLTRDELARCMSRDEALTARQAELDAEKRLNDREGDSIARAAAYLAEELRRVDPADAAAVAAHNARTAEHNRRVEAHNLRVHDMNVAARRQNGEQADMQVTCGTRSYYPQDRDAILYERARLR